MWFVGVVLIVPRLCSPCLMKILFVPTAVWCLATTCLAVTEEFVPSFFSIPVCVPVAEAPPEKAERNRAGDSLDGLREHLGGLAQDLEQTHKAVEDMARQRDMAREKAKQSAEAQRLAMEESASLRKQLAAAREESAQWKAKAGSLEEKMKEEALAKADLQSFRGELRGAMKEFQAMKEDFGQAREVLEDPKERAELRKAAKELTVELESAVKRNMQAMENLKEEREATAAELRATKELAAEKTALVELGQSKITMLERAAEKPREELQRSEESRRQAMEQVREANVEASKVRADLEMMKKAKIGLEELLFRKTDEVRGLKKRVKELEEAGKEDLPPAVGDRVGG